MMILLPHPSCLIAVLRPKKRTTVPVTLQCKQLSGRPKIRMYHLHSELIRLAILHMRKLLEAQKFWMMAMQYNSELCLLIYIQNKICRNSKSQAGEACRVSPLKLMNQLLIFDSGKSAENTCISQCINLN
jgi:hypothetical protein